MQIVWDEPKRRANIDAHEGLDFADLTVEFFENATIYPAKRGRFIALSRLNGMRLIAVIFAQLGSEAVSVISMRPANIKERKSL